ARVVGMSDSSGAIHDEGGITPERLEWLMELKNVRRGRIHEYAEHFKGVKYFESSGGHSSDLWKIPADCAFPCATQNELHGDDAASLIANKCMLVAEGANMPSTPEAVEQFHEA